MTHFKDHFSTQSSFYRAYRPSYPTALYQYLASIAPATERAWDCATGNGQAAIGLASFFDRVVATDASSEQLRHAQSDEKVSYRLAPAEQTDIDSGSTDLVTVAQAIHWFEIDRFYEEAKRVLKTSGVIAAWAYSLCSVIPQIDEIVEEFYLETLEPYWPPERALVDARYTTISFPFEPISAPRFDMTESWTLDHFCGYLSSWSAVQRYKDDRGQDPVRPLRQRLYEPWGQTDRVVRWPLAMRVGRV